MSSTHQEPTEKMTAGKFVLAVLNGISIAVVVALVPQALLGELAKALLPYWAPAATVLALTALASSMLPAMIGLLVAMQFKMTPIQTACVSIAAVCGSGVARVNPEGGFFLKGTGLVVNSGLTAALAVGLLIVIGGRLKNYSILLLSTLCTLIAGGIGWAVTYPAVSVATVWVGTVVNGATSLQPIAMGIVLAVMFSVLVVSPISTVGIATAIFMEGVSAGTANLGVVAAGFTLLCAGWRVNGFATSILHVFGSPKVQMANMFSRPVTFLPVICSAVILGGIGGAVGISGTSMSAGFGITGLIGPLAALNAQGWGWTGANLGIIALIYIVLPIALGIGFSWFFERVLRITKAEYYKLDFV